MSFTNSQRRRPLRKITHQRGIQAHLKSKLDIDDTDGPLIEDDEDGDDDKASFLAELRRLAELTQELASQ
jgi:hypothetical protein